MRRPLAAILVFCLAACTRESSETPEPIKAVLALYAPGLTLGESTTSLDQTSDLSFSPYVGYTDTLKRPGRRFQRGGGRNPLRYDGEPAQRVRSYSSNPIDF